MAFQLPLLPEDYTVGPNDVIIGRGKKCTNNPGNLRFRGIVQTTLESYQTAETKVKKSEIIMDVLSQVREGDGAGFVKTDSATGRYIQVEEASCRIAIAQAFRDALSGAYKSSKKHKQMRRLERKRNSANSILLSSQQQAELELAALEAEQAPRRRSMPDLSHGIAMFQLRGLLQEASNVQHVIDHNDASLAVAAFHNSQAAMPTLSSLYSSFNGNANGFHQAAAQAQMQQRMMNQAQCHDPFEPTPLTNYASLPQTFFTSEHGPRAA